MIAPVSQVSSRALPNFGIRLLQIIPEIHSNFCRLYRIISTASELLNTE